MLGQSQSHPGEYLRTRFLEPLGLSAADLARGCRMPRSRVSDILAGKRSITADSAMRLGAFFRMDAATWLALQAAWDLQQVRPDDSIVALDPPGFLLGPLGATPIPARPRARPPHLRLPDGRPTWVTGPEAVEARLPAQHTEVCYPDGTRALVSRHG